MHIEKLGIINFRSCQNLVIELTNTVPNIFIGINDCGKSTILKALDLLLGEKPKFNAVSEGQNRNDVSNTQIEQAEFEKVFTEFDIPFPPFVSDTTYVIGKLSFTEKEEKNFQTLNMTPGLQWCLENSLENTIHILKTFTGNQSKLFLLTTDDGSNSQLWLKSQTDLNKIIKVEGVSDEDIKNENGKGKFSNFEKLRAVYNKIGTESIWAEHKFGKDDKDIFPEFKYFDWNCSFEDINSLADSIMKEHIEVHLTPLKEKAREAAGLAEAEINKKFGELSETIRSVAKGVENINSKVHFDVKEKISDIMVKKSSSDGFIHLENQGEGLKRQIWFSLIKSKAEITSEEDINKFIWAFDEPETHLYPAAQREFFDIINKISAGNVQNLICTHSTVFIDKSKMDYIQSVTQSEDGYSIINQCKDVDSIYSSLGVKNSDFLFFDKFLIVEGDTEQYLIPKMFELYTGETLLDRNIQLVNIQGKDKWVINKAMIDKIMHGFKKADVQLVYVFDNDMSFEIGVSAVTDNMFFIGSQDIEDSIESSCWAEILNSKYEGDLSFFPEEINTLRGDIPDNRRIDANGKFYKKLDTLIVNKWRAAGKDIDELVKIPSKGKESSDFIMTAITGAEKIPEKIKLAFDKLILA